MCALDAVPRIRKAKQAEAHAPAELLSPEAAEPRSDTPNDPVLAEATLRELAASAKSEPVRLRVALSLANRAEPLDELGDDEPDAQPDYDALRDNHPDAAVSFHAVKLAEALTACRAAGIEQPSLTPWPTRSPHSACCSDPTAATNDLPRPPPGFSTPCVLRLSGPATPGQADKSAVYAA